MDRRTTYDYPQVCRPTSQPVADHQRPRHSWMEPPSSVPSQRHNDRRARPLATLTPIQTASTVAPHAQLPSPVAHDRQARPLDGRLSEQLACAHLTSETDDVPQSSHADWRDDAEPLPVKTAPTKEFLAHLGPDTNPLTPTSPLAAKPNYGQSNANRSFPGPPSFPTAAVNTSTFPPTPHAITGGNWQHGLCSCAEPSVCLSAIVCPCVVYGKTQYRLGLRADKKDPTNLLGYSAVNGSCVTWAVLCGLNSVLTALQRTRVRRAYDMDGSAGNVVGDCVQGLCCCCCVLAQDEKEIRCREEQRRRHAAAGGAGTTDVGIQAYVPPGGMTFAAPPR